MKQLRQVTETLGERCELRWRPCTGASKVAARCSVSEGATAWRERQRHGDDGVRWRRGMSDLFTVEDAKIDIGPVC
jgi:hypothetical protein